MFRINIILAILIITIFQVNAMDPLTKHIERVDQRKISGEKVESFSYRLKKMIEIGKGDKKPIPKHESWEDIRQHLNSPVPKTTSEYLKLAEQKWQTAYKADQAKHKAVFEKFLNERIKERGDYPLTPAEIESEFRVYRDYELLKNISGDSSDIPTFEEFKKDPSLYVTRNGLETIIHLPSKDTTDCSRNKYEIIECDEGEYIYVGNNAEKEVKNTLDRSRIKPRNGQKEQLPGYDESKSLSNPI